MLRRVATVALLVIIAHDAEAKRKNFGQILESPEYKEVLGWLAPENMFTDYNSTLLNPHCQRHLNILNDALDQRETWALKMLDASSKLPSGLLGGNFVDLGQYEECSAVHSASAGNEIRGHHCMYSIHVSHETLSLPVNPTLSICLPASCSSSDIVAFYKTSTFLRIDKLKDLKIEIVSSKCSVIDPVVWDGQLISWTIVMVSFVSFLIVCTVIETSQKRTNSDHSMYPIFDSLAMFSLRKSAKSILSMEVKKGTLPAIDGLRCLSMGIIILFHQYNLWIEGAIVNTLDFFEFSVSWKSLHLYMSLYAVDTFFAVGGFLMTYLFLKQMPKQKKFDVLSYYLHRYLRLTPVVAALMVFALVFIPKFGSGAYWDSRLHNYVGSCQTKWWPALVYLQNFVDKENYCLHHLWYLAVDMQLFWISPLILYPLYKKPKYGLILIATLLASSMIYSASIIGIGNLHTSSFHQDLNATIRRQVFMDVYSIPYHRAGPWLVGILFGYEITTHDRKLNRLNVAAGWLLAIGSFAFCFFGKRSFLDPDYEYNAVWETFFSVVSRPIWGFGICWIIYTSIKNQAGIVSTLLSFRIFLPLSRLSYSVYLIHFVMLTIDNAALKTPQYFSEYYLYRSFLDTLIISTVIAFVFHLLFESPILVLEKILKGKPQHQLQKSSEVQSKPEVNEKSEPNLVLQEFSKIEHPTIETNVTDN